MIVDYLAIMSRAPSLEYGALCGFLDIELPRAWAASYNQQTPRPTDIVSVPMGTFDFLYDFYTIADSSDPAVPANRLVGALGWSDPTSGKRPKSRMQGWLKNPTSTDAKLFKNRDRGHFIAQSICGDVECVEANLFVQDRRLNQGLSLQGKVYRSMERYCAKHAGTFCFSRPHYVNATDRPSKIDFGLLRPDSSLWVDTFDNSIALVD